MVHVSLQNLCCDITAGGQPTDKGVITSPDGSVRFEVSCYSLCRVWHSSPATEK